MSTKVHVEFGEFTAEQNVTPRIRWWSWIKRKTFLADVRKKDKVSQDITITYPGNLKRIVVDGQEWSPKEEQ